MSVVFGSLTVAGAHLAGRAGQSPPVASAGFAFGVDDIYATCAHLQSLGVTINRPPRDGRMAFVRSPDNISIEIHGNEVSLAAETRRERDRRFMHLVPGPRPRRGDDGGAGEERRGRDQR